MPPLRETIKLGLVGLAIVLTVRCGKLDSPKSGAAVVGASTTTTTLPSIFSVEVATIYETDPNNTETPQGSTCTVTRAPLISVIPSTKICSTISIPEGQLYYSKVKIKANILDPKVCKFFTFRPYYYRMSVLNNFIPSTSNGSFSAIDCRDSTNANCYSGPATKLAPNFPENTAVYYLSAQGTSVDWTIDSANSIRQSSKYDPGNKWAANDLYEILNPLDILNPIASYRSLFYPDYVPSSMVDYSFVCEDPQNETIYLAIMKLAVDPGPAYQHPHWESSVTTTSTSTTTTSTTTTTNPQIFRLSVSTVVDTGGNSKRVTLQGSPCDVTTTSGPVNCSVSIPEMELYYGELLLDVSQINNKLCPSFSFEPYYFQMSDKANFIPSTGTQAYYPDYDPNIPFSPTGWDCRTGLAHPECFSGAARQLVPGFPVETRIQVFTDPNAPSLSWTVQSAASVASSQNYNPGNRWTVNDLIARNVNQTDYVANSMHDYAFTCLKSNGEALYSAKLVISPDTATPARYANWQPTTTTTTSTSTTSTTTTTTTTNPTVFQVQLATIFESDPSSTPTDVTPDPLSSCSIDKSRASENCKFVIPESQLYFSKLKLSVSVKNSNLCRTFTFTPYVYQMSSSATFSPSGKNAAFSGTVDCSGASGPPPISCYSGTGVEVLTSYPAFTSVWYLPQVTPNTSWTFNSAHNRFMSDNYDVGNTWAANDLANRASVPLFTPPDYLSNTMQGYRFVCEDWYGNALHTIDMEISSDPGSDGLYKFINWKAARTP